MSGKKSRDRGNNNDDPDTTKADVLAMFDRAIEASKENP